MKGAQLFPRAWIEFMTTPRTRYPGYGAQTWLNGPQAENGDTGGKSEFPGAPASVSAAQDIWANTLLLHRNRA